MTDLIDLNMFKELVMKRHRFEMDFLAIIKNNGTVHEFNEELRRRERIIKLDIDRLSVFFRESI